MARALRGALMAAAAAAAIGAGCGDGDGGAGAAPGTGSGLGGGTLLYALAGRAQELDPLLATSRSEQIVTRQVHEPLVESLEGPFGESRRRRGLARRWRASGDHEIWPRAIVCAVPWYGLRATFWPEPPPLSGVFAAADATPASPIVTVNLWLDRDVTRAAFIGLPGRTMQWVFDKRMLFGEGASHLSLVSSGAEAVVAKSNDELVALALEELRSACPEARDAAVRRAVVVRERKATFSVAPGVPSRPGVRTAIPGLFLAGDWIGNHLPATIEGAVISGHSAAREAASYLEL